MSAFLCEKYLKNNYFLVRGLVSPKNFLSYNFASSGTLLVRARLCGDDSLLSRLGKHEI